MTRLLITASTLVDGKGKVQHPSGVLVSDGEITAVGAQAELQQQFGLDDLAREHFDGCTLLPGLIDTHTHLRLPGNGLTADDYRPEQAHPNGSRTHDKSTSFTGGGVYPHRDLF